MSVTVERWPMTEHDGPVRIGDVVKMPAGGIVTRVAGVSYGYAATGCYLNGFYIADGERLELVRRPGGAVRHAALRETGEDAPSHREAPEMMG